MPQFPRSIALAMLLTLGLASAALAADGVLEINNACVGTGCFPGDDAGFPVTITRSGSYRLTGPLAVSSGGIIEITAAGVLLDLNGFTLACNTLFGSCSSGPGNGILATRDNVTVRNGTVQFFGAAGIRLEGEGSVAEKLRVRGNTGRGLDMQDADFSYAREVIALDNQNTGIIVGEAGLIQDCISANNGGTGLLAGQGGLISDSTARGNNTGAATASFALIHRVVATDNNFGVSSGLNAAHGLTVTGQNNNSDLSAQDRVACDAIGGAVTCP